MTMTRRRLLGGLASLLAAPAIVRVGSLMPVSTAALPLEATIEWVTRLGGGMIDWDAVGGYTVARYFDAGGVLLERTTGRQYVAPRLITDPEHPLLKHDLPRQEVALYRGRVVGTRRRGWGLALLHPRTARAWRDDNMLDNPGVQYAREPVETTYIVSRGADDPYPDSWGTEAARKAVARLANPSEHARMQVAVIFD